MSDSSNIPASPGSESVRPEAAPPPDWRERLRGIAAQLISMADVEQPRAEQAAKPGEAKP